MISYNDIQSIIQFYLDKNNIKPKGLERGCYSIYITKEYLQNVIRYRAELKYHGKDTKVLLFSDFFLEEIYCLIHLVWVINNKPWADAQVFDKWIVNAIGDIQ